MIPLLTEQPKTDKLHRQYIRRLKQQSFRGDISTGFSDRLMAATDNSVYQLLPQVVLYPKTIEDIQKIFRLGQEPMFNRLHFTNRGGGTGTCGQALNHSVIIDCTRHLKQILELNVDEQWVRVQPGVVLDTLNSVLSAHDMEFPIHIAPSDRATLGGMCNTDASGKGSLVHGKFHDHVLELNVILSNGDLVTIKPLSKEELKEQLEYVGLIQNVYRQLTQTLTEHKELIDETYPKLIRSMSGYDLVHCQDDAGNLDLIPLICGSEGTLATVVELKLKLTPIKAHKALLVIQYDDFFTALDDAQSLINLKPSAIETIDDAIIDAAKQQPIGHEVERILADLPTGPTRGLNFVEFSADETSMLEALVTQAKTSLNERDIITKTHVFTNQTDIERHWQLRKRCASLLGNLENERMAIPFIEDTVVSPKQLPKFVRDLKNILDDANLSYSMFGHADAGCLHIRPALNLIDGDDRILFGDISDKVAELTKQYGGVFWGEHGKGMRSQYMPMFFGTVLYDEIKKIKEVFDPNNQLNPGKIAIPKTLAGHVYSINSPMRADRDNEVFSRMREKFPQPFTCNGNALCRSVKADNLLCPSYQTTQKILYSPQGRSILMREWLAQQCELGAEVEVSERLYSPGRFFLRFKNTFSRSMRKKDFSSSVHDSMRLCLGCKACTQLCPSKVDIPKQKAMFLERYYSRYLRPLADYIFAMSESCHGLIRRLNLDSSHLCKRILKRLGIMHLPTQAALSYQQLLRQHKLKVSSIDECLNADVIILPDYLYTNYHPQVIIQLMQIISRLGYQVALAPVLFNGKVLHNLGFLNKFKHKTQKTVDFLNRCADRKIPVIGIDPSMLLTFRDEYISTHGESYRGRVFSMDEWLITQKKKLLKLIHDDNDSSCTYRLFLHCSERSLMDNVAKNWQTIFTTFDLNLEIINTGCCGMAGDFGLRVDNQAHSTELYKQHLASAVTNEPLETLCVTGFSCREQIKIRSKVSVQHPIELLARFIKILD